MQHITYLIKSYLKLYTHLTELLDLGTRLADDTAG